MAVWLVLALVFVLSAGRAGSSPPVQAAPPGATPIDVVLVVESPRSEYLICVGSSVEYWVQAWKLIELDGEGPAQAYMAGVKVEASVANPAVGTISPATAWSGWNEPHGRALFLFTAEAPGMTPIYFTAQIPPRTVSALALGAGTVSAEGFAQVRQCEYKVIGVLRYLSNAGPPNVISWTGRINGLGLIADGETEGHYLGVGIVNWSAETLYSDSPCWVEHLPARSQVTVRGKKFGDLMDVSLEFEPAKVLGMTMHCPDAPATSGFQNLTYPIDPLRVWLPTSGGAKTLDHGFGEVDLSFGQAVISLYPVNTK